MIDCRRLRGVLGVSSALSTLLLLSACKDTIDRPPITRQEYVDTYVEIIRASDEEPDSIAASRRAQEILDRRGITQEDLLAYAEHYIDDPEHLAEIWFEIESIIRTPQDEDSTEAQNDPEAEAVDARARSDGR
jgi:hypothetical protein